jgi:hypothetical protein
MALKYFRLLFAAAGKSSLASMSHCMWLPLNSLAGMSASWSLLIFSCRQDSMMLRRLLCEVRSSRWKSLAPKYLAAIAASGPAESARSADGVFVRTRKRHRSPRYRRA